MSLLLPDGITHLADLPNTMFDALRLALSFLQFDELPKDERPPRRIWLDPERMSEWWKAVEKRRDERIKGDGSSEIDDPVSNSAARDLVR